MIVNNLIDDNLIVNNLIANNLIIDKTFILSININIYTHLLSYSTT
ncbi:hypothetical protein GXM_07844 [Nostoc sphaeroides CCNUC1]|uniref:Uncharacterized protein n=1 Tax=Nostoc sphaeroides CCNUC1 TaxID=2653204 RepID=A0A5P8WCK6_9NOSO|nr:hypothetical protein GXM_07844 [Nostoc sphaeroides CCNUC1]